MCDEFSRRTRIMSQKRNRNLAMRAIYLFAVIFTAVPGQAQAYDAGKAGTYVSPDMNNAHANTITLHGKGSTGPADTFNITLPNGSTMLLGDVVNPITSPILAKFRAITATYEDFASAGDGKPWTESTDVCPAINAAYAYLRNRGGGTLNLPPNVARCATPLRAPNMSFITTNGQGVGAFSQSGTELRWTGALGAIMLDLRATTAQTPVSGVRIYGLVLNGNGRAKTGLLVRGLKYSNIELLAQNTTFAGVDIDIDEAKGPLAVGQLTGQDWAAYSTGSGGTNGTYTNVPLYNAGGTEGAGATADVTIANGSISNIVIKTGGDKYVLGDILGIASGNIGGTTGVFITAGNTGNASTSNLDTSQNVWNLRVTQQGPASINALGVRIGFGSSWLDTNSSIWLNVLTLTQNGTGFEIGDADTNEFVFVRAGIEGPAPETASTCWAANGGHRPRPALITSAPSRRCRAS
ncbi:hypothetical protein R1A27_22215 [Methylobacterium sp. NMS12]|uniref:hypothetical protein n=1 Tax=Methylobacterium sp. NMS12 TaxID=3079766 RepID=UPI003F880A3A